MAFDGPVVGVVGDVQYFVVIFGLGSFQLHLSLLEQLSDPGCGGMMILCGVEGLNAGFVLLSVELALGEREKGGERVRFEI